MEDLLVYWKLPKFPLNLKWIVTLEYFEGEFLALFENEEGDFYLYSWCDRNDEYNRWLVFRITLKNLQKYLEGKKHFEKSC